MSAFSAAQELPMGRKRGAKGEGRRLRLVAPPMNPISYLETNVLLCEDNLDALPQIPSECIDLIYLDPPFFSNRQYEVIWGDEAEMRSFRDRWRGGIKNYIDWIKQRAVELQRVLKPTGAVYLHCDPHASHYLKVMLDGIFGGENFRNEIIWKRTSAHSSAKRFGPVHDVILVYGKSKNVEWYGSTVPHDPEYVEGFFRQVEPDSGRRFHANVLTGSGTRRGDSGLPWRGYNPTEHGRHWAVPGKMIDQLGLEGLTLHEKLDALDAAGRIHWPQRGAGYPRLKYYEDELAGQPAPDVWTDIRPVGRSKERQGYPTQKPEALLERIIMASSREGAVILDPFCGCGTTVAVASRLRRKWIGIDISPTAMRVIRRRLNRDHIYDFRIDGLPETEDDLRKLEHFEFQNWVIDVLHGKHSPRKVGDMGIDGYSFLELAPIQVKQVDRVDRPELDKFETAVRRDGKQKGYIVAFGFSKGAHDEVARARDEGLEIGLVTVATLLDNPHDQPLRADLPELTRELLESARTAAARASFRPEPPPRRPEELEASIEAEAKVG